MSHKSNILQCLQNLPNCVTESLIYQLILYCDKVTFTGNIINVYAVKRESLVDVFNGRILMKIIIINGRLQIWLPSYHDKCIFSCNIDQKYVIDERKIKLCSVFRIIYNNIFLKLDNGSLTNICESLMLVGIKQRVENQQIIRVVHDDNIYTDLASRLLVHYSILFEGILYFQIKYNPDDILKSFRGLLMNYQVDDHIARGIVYLKSDNELTIDDLSRFPSLMFADIVCEYDLSMCNKYKSLRINNTMVQGQSPYNSFMNSK